MSYVQYYQELHEELLGAVDSKSVTEKLSALTELQTNPPKDVFAIAISEISDNSSECESTEAGSSVDGESVRSPASISSGSILEAFQRSKSQWIDDPIISQWRDPQHRIYDVLGRVEALRQAWSTDGPGPFSASHDPLWLDTGRALAEAGLPWHNNQINMPEELDSSWPFHFKSFEMALLADYGARLGDRSPSGYVCNPVEANCWCLRALQQELRLKVPGQKPLLVCDRIDDQIIQLSKTLFGLEVCRVDLSAGVADVAAHLKEIASQGAIRPIIFASTLTNNNGECDDFSGIGTLSEQLPLLLHVDASRNFDYISTLGEEDRAHLQLPKFSLGINAIGQSLQQHNGTLLASTLVAGSTRHARYKPAVALKPAALGGKQVRVAYTRASDSTLAGSRDAIAPLWMAVHELRFSTQGFRDQYQYCAKLRDALVSALKNSNVPATGPQHSFDVLIQGGGCSQDQKRQLLTLGASVVALRDDENAVLLSIRPDLTLADIESLMLVFGQHDPPQELTQIMQSREDYQRRHPVPVHVRRGLRDTVQSWKIATRTAAGYPFHMGSYSALGPVSGKFLDISIPPSWLRAVSSELLAERMKMFGLRTTEAQSEFRGAFTNGSTMGNRLGIHVALAHFPDAYLYFSAESHYSIPKTARDDDELAGRWPRPESCVGGIRYTQVPCDAQGSILCDALVAQAMRDREMCKKLGRPYKMILFANMGTTFVGARDDLTGIYEALNASGLDQSLAYIHVDGALDFGFSSCGVTLGPPGTRTFAADGTVTPCVQGVTVSNHKAMGHMVSGQVLCYSPGEQLPALAASVEENPRAVFESWLYAQVYTAEDRARMLAYGRANAERLEGGLRRAGVVVKRNRDRREDSSGGGSTTTVLERPPAWIIEEFSLRPEGDWVHFITMPHVSPETVDLFVDRVAHVDRMTAVAFSYVEPLFSEVLFPRQSEKGGAHVTRVTPRSALAQRVLAAAEIAAAASSPSTADTTAHDLVPVVKAGLRGALTVAVLDDSGDLHTVVALESCRDRSIRVGPVLLNSRHGSRAEEVLDVCRQTVGHLSRNLGCKVLDDEIDFACFVF